MNSVVLTEVLLMIVIVNWNKSVGKGLGKLSHCADCVTWSLTDCVTH